MKASVLPNAEHPIVLRQQQQQQQRRPSDILEESYVTQSVNNSRRNSNADSIINYNALSAASDTADLDVESLVNSAIWPLASNAATKTIFSSTATSGNNSKEPSPPASTPHPLDSTLMMNDWNPNVTSTRIKTEAWDMAMQPQPHQQPLQYPSDISFLNNDNSQQNDNGNFPMHSSNYNHVIPMNNFSYHGNFTDITNGFNSAPPSMVNTALSTPNSGLVTPPMSNYFPARNSLPAHSKKMPPFDQDTRRRSSTTDTHHPQRTYGRRASSHPSVASVVSLTAHEPISKIIDGIEHITFLYSHDRLVKEYTVRTDIDNVNIDDITMDFRIQNAIYPRANVNKSEYDGNRWDYETTCNQLGWKLCWLNKDQLFGRRGLIQRAVDSYRNRHAEMRSRRVTRQEKVANGTLRKRRSKKSLTSNML
ncbi:uncharacterized protein ATC70_004805 [Mucor velutinosus]|uniref:DUF8032 domain-containing protein n=1 Tax=Mucor velutinosus TaxID=708070 RepID=A0AAN7D9I2_9FUNG|nr:hypothetical protein ATC70_004805 [Mucor velutinosus]